MFPQHRSNGSDRRGALIVWFAFMLIVIFAMAAFAIDLGYMEIAGTQLQNAADGAALSGITQIASGTPAVISAVQDIGLQNKVAGKAVTFLSTDVEFGRFDTSTRLFVANVPNVNAIRVTARLSDQGLFFAPVLGKNSFSMSKSAVAMLNPRDIAFVVDLSGSMNDDTEPCWASREISNKFTPLGYPTVANDLMQNVFDDFGYGTYPGTVEPIFGPLNLGVDPHYAYAEVTKDGGALTGVAIASQSRISDTDSETVRKVKAYRWIIDNQLKRLMPNAKPAPDWNSPTTYAYWEKYLDYMIVEWGVGISPPPPPPDNGGGGAPSSPPPPPPPSPPAGFIDPKSVPHFFEYAHLRRSDAPRLLGTVAGASNLVALQALFAPVLLGSGPPNVGVPRNGSSAWTEDIPYRDWRNIYFYNNPNTSTFPSADGSDLSGWENMVGYITYTQFMMDSGRDRSPVPDISISAQPGSGLMTPLSIASPDCPYHAEVTAGGTFSFPPREQPTHAVRRALIAAVQEIKTKNSGLSAAAADQVSLITFDGVDANHAPTIVVPLTTNYDSTMASCTTIQAVSDIGNTTATENGVLLARQHLSLTANGGRGRSYTTKVVVLCTDGVPNVWSSSDTTVNAGMAANPSADYYASPYLWYNSVLMQAADMNAKKKEKLYPVGMGLGADRDFTDRIARLAGTDVGGLSPRGTGNPADYENQLIQIFKKIINTRSGRLMK